MEPTPEEAAGGRAGSAARRRSPYITLPPWFMQLTLSFVSVKPWPLQAFWPLQALVALLHALWPLQAFVPWHFTPSAWAAVTNVPAANSAAAVVINVRLVMRSLLIERASGSLRDIRQERGRRYAALDKICRVCREKGL